MMGQNSSHFGCVPSKEEQSSRKQKKPGPKTKYKISGSSYFLPYCTAVTQSLQYHSIVHRTVPVLCRRRKVSLPVSTVTVFYNFLTVVTVQLYSIYSNYFSNYSRTESGLFLSFQVPSKAVGTGSVPVTRLRHRHHTVVQVLYSAGFNVSISVINGNPVLLCFGLLCNLSNTVILVAARSSIHPSIHTYIHPSDFGSVPIITMNVSDLRWLTKQYL
jgi:hypothetical protein